LAACESRFAQDLAARIGGDDVLFVATAETRDDEMLLRVEHHRRSRPATWQTLERPLGTGLTIVHQPALPRVVLVDCLTLLVSNVLCCEDSQSKGIDDLLKSVEAEIEGLIAVAARRSVHLIIVSGEVGLGVVPDHAMGRIFRDLLGWANQRVARCATTTYWMVAGIPIDATKLQSSIDEAAEKIAITQATGSPT
jgi:adenosylcobinamide kinase/adenosylcobinamide-phosphate guanylyltransferase